MITVVTIREQSSRGYMTGPPLIKNCNMAFMDILSIKPMNMNVRYQNPNVK
jgi:hypothetical protein